MNTLIFNLPRKISEELETQSIEQKISVLEIIYQALNAYLAPDDPDEEEILANLPTMIEEVLAGKTRPWKEAFEEIKRELEEESANRKLLLSGETHEMALKMPRESIEELKAIAHEQEIEISELVLIALELYFDEE